MQIWRVDVATQKLNREPVPAGWEKLGGRGLLARIMLDEVEPTCEPLGSKNKLIYAPGLLVGQRLSSCDRLSVGGKSPLTGGIKEANAGGRTGLHMAMMGMKALILEGKPTVDGWWILHLSLEGARWEKADELAGLGIYDATPKLIEKYGKHVAIALIGLAGELELASAGIQNIDKDRIPSRMAARGGLGAVMGSKGLKAIIFDNAGGENPPQEDPDKYKPIRKSYTTAVINHPQSLVYKDYGTAAMTMMCNAMGALPTRNFSNGEFEQAESISGDTMRAMTLERGGKGAPAHACMAGCTIQCSNIFPDANGEPLVSPLEYETIGLMGSNLGIDSFDTIGQLNYVANDLGLDSIELGAALGVAAEAGLMAWGDGERALQLVDEIRQNTPLGRILGMGATITGKVLGVERVPAVKGQAMSSYEPRAIKGTGVTYATSPQGADHTSGLTIRAKVNHLDPKGQVAVSLNSQLNNAGYDSLGACLFSGFGFSTDPTLVPNLVRTIYGWEVPDNYLQALGKETIKMEREWNRRAGFTNAHDRLPEWMTREPVPPTNAVFDVPNEELDTIFDKLD
jgi:aldehyde:ferredoxin oxidoreductase